MVSAVNSDEVFQIIGSAASYTLFSQHNSMMHVISKYPDKVSKASRTLHEVAGEFR